MAPDDDEAPGDDEEAESGRRDVDDNARPYDVGHGKPPVHSRWVKGQSGNPRGRPRKAKNQPFATKANPVRDIVLEEMARVVTVKEAGEATELETMRAIIRSVAVAAIKGGRSQQRTALQYATAAEASRRDELEERMRSVMLYKHNWGEQFERARRLGHPEPDQLPHPDHVDIDPATLEVVFSGPICRFDKRKWDLMKFQLRESERLLLAAQRAASRKRATRIEKERKELLQQHFSKLEGEVPERWNWRESLGWEEAYTKRMFKGLDLPWPPKEGF